MARATRTNQQNTPGPSGTTNLTADASAEKPFDPTRSKAEAETYRDAEQENHEYDFRQAILKSRTPPPAPAYVPPIPAPAILEQTRLEMEAGAKRVAEFAAQEKERQAAHAAHKADKWADKGSVEVFRPADYVPDQKKGQGNVGGTSQPI